MALARATTHTTAADGTFSAAGATAWNLAHTMAITGAVSGGVPFFSSTTAEGTSALLSANAVVLGGGAGAAPLTSSKLSEGSAAGQGLIVAAGTAASAVSALALTQTRNFNTSATDYFSLSFIETSIHGSDRAFAIFGGAAGTTFQFGLRSDGVGTMYVDTKFGYYIGDGVDGYFTSAGPKIRSDAAILWANSGNANTGTDTVVSRMAAGVVGIGLTASGQNTGAIDATLYKAAGTAGVANFGPSIVTSITVKGGIITAIS